MKGDFHVRFRENLRVKLPWVTRLAVIGLDNLDDIIKVSRTSANTEL
jgi:hypothetical protein